MNLTNKINKVPTVQGETIKDWEKIKKYKMSIGKFYTGPFATSRGNPDFGIFPLISKYIFISYALYYSVSKNYKYVALVAFIYFIGCILNGVRFYYIDTLTEYGEDDEFLKTIVNDNIIGGVLSLIAVLYVLFKK
jgi:hypothetical protein